MVHPPVHPQPTVFCPAAELRLLCDGAGADDTSLWESPGQQTGRKTHPDRRPSTRLRPNRLGVAGPPSSCLDTFWGTEPEDRLVPPRRPSHENTHGRYTCG